MITPSGPNRWEAILEQSAAAFLAGQLAEPPVGSEAGETAGTLVGRYRLVEEIGRGGMGAVWLAEVAERLYRRAITLYEVELPAGHPYRR